MNFTKCGAKFLSKVKHVFPHAALLQPKVRLNAGTEALVQAHPMAHAPRFEPVYSYSYVRGLEKRAV